MNDITNLTVLTPGQPAGTVAPPNVMAPGTVFANPSTQWATPVNLTFADLTLELGLFTAVDRGVVPASGGGTINFLRADGTWAPAGLGDITGPALMGSLNATPGPPIPLTSAQFTAMIDLFTATTSGTVPASGGTTIDFLRADGTWTQPAADGPLPAGTVWGNPMPSAGPGMAMTPAMVTPLLDLFTQTTRGLVPPSGAFTSYFLRGDGTWALPPESAPIPPFTVLGNFSPATTVPGPITTTQLTQMIDLFTATTAGTVPQSGGGTSNFLRADGVWTAPPGLAPIPGPAVLGVTTTAPGVPHALSQSELTLMLNLFTATTRGIVPASGGGTERFLRADGAWADVPEFPLPNGPAGLPLVGNGALPPTYQQLTAAGIANGAVTNIKLANMPAATIKGNQGPASGPPHDLSGEEVTDMLRLFTTTQRGVVPPSTNLGYFLRGDGTWHDIDPSGMGPIPNNTFLGNTSGGIAPPSPLPISQLVSGIPVFTQLDNGLVPAPGAGTVRYLASDGAWNEIVPAGTNGQLQYNNNGAWGGSTWTFGAAGNTLRGPAGSVANLPAPSAALIGARATVNDALGTGLVGNGSPTGIVQGGGANVIPVFCNGTNWLSLVPQDAMLLTVNNTMDVNAAINWGPGRPTLNWAGLVVPGAVGSFVNGPTIFYNTVEFIGGLSASNVIFSTTTVNFTNLPTTDPNIVGRAWNNNGVLTISAG